VTSLPDWLVERHALDEVPRASRARLAHADPLVLVEDVAALQAADAAELAAHPPAPAIAQITARVAVECRARTQRRRRQLGLVVLATSTAAALVLVRTAREPTARDVHLDQEVTRVKGGARLLAFRQVGEQVERLEQDAIAHAGDMIQLRYHAGGQRHGMIASIDGAGVVTLHFPADETTSTAIASDTTALPHAYALDDAPRFERFFFITASQPIDVDRTLAALRTLAQRSDAATAPVELSPDLRQWSLRLRKATQP